MFSACAWLFRDCMVSWVSLGLGVASAFLAVSYRPKGDRRCRVLWAEADEGPIEGSGFRV